MNTVTFRDGIMDKKAIPPPICFLQFNGVVNINLSGEKRKRVKRGALEKTPMHHPRLFLANMPFSQGRVVFLQAKNLHPSLDFINFATISH